MYDLVKHDEGDDMSKVPRVSLAEVSQATGKMLAGDSTRLNVGAAPTLDDLTQSLPVRSRKCKASP